MDQKSIFISYRRNLSKHLARSVYLDLKHHGWDVFLDVNTIDSGDFDRIILNQIAARAHFVLLISPGSLERCANPGDWVLREIEEAVRLERNIVPVIEEGADYSREMGYLPEDLRAVLSKKNALPLPHFFFDAAVDMLRTRFLKTPEYIQITDAPAAERAEVQRRMATVEAAETAEAGLMPQPFTWITIPGKGYAVGKYPVTNAQYAVFIQAGGYQQRQWWTKPGWKQRETDKWREPRYWRDAAFNSPEQPVVAVSWYEAVAFCQWLSQTSQQKIMLPSEAQWQYAAQGTDGRIYPWGNQWDGNRCNHNGSGVGKTSPVTRYDGSGDSPFGVVDMAGNVWEWCLNSYETGQPALNGSDIRALRGGAWNLTTPESFQCTSRNWTYPYASHYSWGFRLMKLVD